MFGDLKSQRLILIKGGLFLLTGLLALGLLIAEHSDLKSVLLMAITIWSFCRAYYFAFYVVEHYVDGNYKFAGLSSFVRFLWQRWRQ